MKLKNLCWKKTQVVSSNSGCFVLVTFPKVAWGLFVIEPPPDHSAGWLQQGG